MGIVHLGKIHLRWCPSCNLPVLEEHACGLCGGKTEAVAITPPGDVRPAFPFDIDLVKEVADRQFGSSCGESLLPRGSIVLLNKVPALDRMDEVIVGGEVIGALRFDIGKGWRLLLRMPAARAIARVATKGYVIADEGAVEPMVEKHMNLMAPGVLESARDVKVGDEVVVLTKERRAVATGTARMTPIEIEEKGKGVAVKTRWTEAPRERVPRDQTHDWSDVLRANSAVLERRVNGAVQFILDTIDRSQLPAVVSFSGGKDSLACLLLTLDAGLRLPILFIDTGLEFPETVEHVREVSERHSLPLIVEKAPDDAFFGNLAIFGPPGRDYRWCCKTNKLGPTVRAIMKHFPKGVLSFIGQRRYESEQGSDKPRIWKNPWTPGQLGASPIQDWTALHVWLYIFSKGERPNPWYQRGLDRIGCYLCPASDLSELVIAEKECEGYSKWREYLDSYARSRGLKEEWVDLALWRWKKIPPSIREEVRGLGLEEALEVGKVASFESFREAERGLTLFMQEGFSPCVKGYSIEGAFSRPLDLDAVANLFTLIGEVEVEKEGGYCSVGDLMVFREGALIAKGKSPQEIKEKVERVRRAVVKAMECAGCGVCIARCDKGALFLKEGRIRVSTAKCVHCGSCIEPCPAISFGDSAFEF